MKYIIPVLATSLALTGCFSGSSSSSSSSKNKDAPLKITEDSYIAQLRSADYQSSSVVIGNMIGNHSVKNTLLAKGTSDFAISTYKNSFYHLGRFAANDITLIDAAKNLTSPVWSYSTNDDGEDSSNPYQVVQVSDSKAYLLRYDSNNLWVINPQAANAESLVTKRIDLSAYADGEDNVARMASAVAYNNKLFVVMQRLDADYQPTEKSCVAIIDTTTDTELNNETGTACVGSKGIKLTAGNAVASVVNNGYLYVANRGDYFSDSGSLDQVDLTTYAVSTIFDKNTAEFSALNDADNFSYFHIFDVAVVDNNNAYIQIEYGSWPNSYKIFPFNPSTKTLSDALSLEAIQDKFISDITLDPNNRLWVAVADDAAPKLVVIDTDTNTQSGDAVELDLIPDSIHFLTAE